MHPYRWRGTCAIANIAIGDVAEWRIDRSPGPVGADNPVHIRLGAANPSPGVEASPQMATPRQVIGTPLLGYPDSPAILLMMHSGWYNSPTNR